MIHLPLPRELQKCQLLLHHRGLVDQLLPHPLGNHKDVVNRKHTTLHTAEHRQPAHLPCRRLSRRSLDPHVNSLWALHEWAASLLWQSSASTTVTPTPSKEVTRTRHSRPNDMLPLVNLLTNKLQHMQRPMAALNLHLKWQDHHLLNTVTPVVER